MNDYKLIKVKNGFKIRELVLSIWKWKIYTYLRFPLLVQDEGRNGRFESYIPVFRTYEDAVFAAETVMENPAKIYRGFILDPIYKLDEFGDLDFSTREYIVTDFSMIGTYLYLTSLIDEHHRATAY